MTKMKFKRMKLGLSQETLSKLTRIPRSDISKIECGRLLPYQKQASRIAANLDMCPDELLKQIEG